MHKAGKITALDGGTFRGNLDAVELGFFELTLAKFDRAFIAKPGHLFNCSKTMYITGGFL